MRHPFEATFYALVVVRRQDRFLLVEELDHDNRQVWYLPAGGVKAGEDFRMAAIRETREEAGIEVEILGLLGGDQVISETSRETRVRLVFMGQPVGGALKSQPDDESLRADWFHPDAIAGLRLRHGEVKDWIAVARRLENTRLPPFACYTPATLRKLLENED